MRLPSNEPPRDAVYLWAIDGLQALVVNQPFGPIEIKSGPVHPKALMWGRAADGVGWRDPARLYPRAAPEMPRVPGVGAGGGRHVWGSSTRAAMQEAVSSFMLAWRPLLRREVSASVMLVCDAPVLLVSEQAFNPAAGYYELRRYNIDTLGGVSRGMSPRSHMPLALQDYSHT